jgi:hypothetical protein
MPPEPRQINAAPVVAELQHDLSIVTQALSNRCCELNAGLTAAQVALVAAQQEIEGKNGRIAELEKRLSAKGKPVSK